MSAPEERSYFPLKIRTRSDSSVFTSTEDVYNPRDFSVGLGMRQLLPKLRLERAYTELGGISAL